MTSDQIPDSNISKFQMPLKPEQSINVKLKKKKRKSCIKKQIGRPHCFTQNRGNVKYYKLHKITHRRYPSLKYLNANKIQVLRLCSYFTNLQKK